MQLGRMVLGFVRKLIFLFMYFRLLYCTYTPNKRFNHIWHYQTPAKTDIISKCNGPSACTLHMVQNPPSLMAISMQWLNDKAVSSLVTQRNLFITSSTSESLPDFNHAYIYIRIQSVRGFFFSSSGVLFRFYYV